MDIETMLKIALLGGLEKSINLSSSQLAGMLGISQQTAARRLKALEEEGLITRRIHPRGQSVHVTEKGRELMAGIYMELSRFYGRPEARFTICGTITTGMGEGEYYMSMEEYARQFEEKLGFHPFPGTLNLKLSASEDIRVRQRLAELPGIMIEGFKKEGRTFGSVKCFRAEIEGVKGAVVMPSRTHHPPDTLEVISKEKLKKKLNVKEGDRICVHVEV